MDRISLDALSRIRGQLADRTGLKLGDQDMDTLRGVVAERVSATGLADAAAYSRRLDTDDAVSGGEWKELVGRLTVGESYFFRDAGQFELLKHLILPELIERAKATRTLRLWSAGCSTGEEPYSLAILLDMLLPDMDRWDTIIMGTDVNPHALQRAREGRFSSYALRALSDDLIKARYFTRHDHHWQLNERIRAQVRFEYGNLVADSFPAYSTPLHDMDLILCRNVFIYFGTDAIARVLTKLADTLRPGGYLITGHGELIGQKLGPLRTRLFPESVIYQRAARGETMRAPSLSQPLVSASQLLFRATAKPKPPPVPQPAATLSPVEVLQGEAESLFLQGNQTAALEKARAVLDLAPERFDAHYLMAQVHANLGEYDAAQRGARRAMEADRFAFGPYYLLAHIAELEGKAAEAKELLNKVIYLAPDFTPAYLDLGALHEREGNTVKARRLREVALRLLDKIPPETPLAPYVELTAGALKAYVSKLLTE